MAKEKEFEYEFDPIKYDKAGKEAEKVVWTTKSLEKAVEALKKGMPLKANPFIGKNTKLLKPDLVFARTQEEIEDYMHCMEDPLYFAEKCFLMTPTGLQAVKLRDYQKDYIKHLQHNRFSIFLSCRQSGKCLTYFNTIKIKVNDSFLTTYKNESKIQNKKIDDILRKYYFYTDNDNNYVIDIPLFELENLFNNSFLWNIKYYLYKIIYNTEYARENRAKN